MTWNLTRLSRIKRRSICVSAFGTYIIDHRKCLRKYWILSQSCHNHSEWFETIKYHIENQVKRSESVDHDEEVSHLFRCFYWILCHIKGGVSAAYLLKYDWLALVGIEIVLYCVNWYIPICLAASVIRAYKVTILESDAIFLNILFVMSMFQNEWSWFLAGLW